MIRIQEGYLNTLSEWRRDFHRYPEPGWLEFRTTAKIADQLEEWGYSVYVGKDIVVGERMGLPGKEEMDIFFERAKRWVPMINGSQKWKVATQVH